MCRKSIFNTQYFVSSLTFTHRIAFHSTQYSFFFSQFLIINFFPRIIQKWNKSKENTINSVKLFTKERKFSANFGISRNERKNTFYCELKWNENMRQWFALLFFASWNTKKRLVRLVNILEFNFFPFNFGKTDTEIHFHLFFNYFAISRLIEHIFFLTKFHILSRNCFVNKSFHT